MIGRSELQGHWRRVWIKAPGFQDHSTAVHWMQRDALYVDVRIPADLPDLSGARSLSELPAEVLLGLMKSEGFAGTIDVADSVCTWTREINWHGTPKVVDAGRMRFKDADHLIEDGVHAKYRELWHREVDRPREAHRFKHSDRHGFLVSSDMCFAFAMGVPDAPATDAFLTALEKGRVPETLGDHFASVYAVGKWDGSEGIVRLCTNPFMRGTPAITKGSDSYHVRMLEFDGSATAFSFPVSSGH